MVAYVQDLLGPFEARGRFRERMRQQRALLLGTSGTVTTVAGVHLGLKRYDRSKVDARDADKLRRILARLNQSRVPADMDAPGFRLHPLKGELKGFWAVTVRANWRVIFRPLSAIVV